MAKPLKKLFEPIKVGNMELKNRIKLPAMAVAMGENEGISEQIKAFYVARAKGGVAIIGISCAATRLIQDPMLGLYHDRFIPGLRDLVEAVHNNGAKVYAQAGVGTSWAFGDGPVEYVSPSGITVSGHAKAPFRMGGPFEPAMPRALSVDEIHQMVQAFGDAANRAKQAGFDAFEVIAAVGFMVSLFLSPLTNKRTDQYGGSFENRIRILLEIIDDIKKKTGKDYPLLCRLSGADLLQPTGYDLEDTKQMARMIEEAGVNQIDVMSGWHETSIPVIQTQVPQGRWVYLAEGVKSAVKIPVATGYMIQYPEVAERVIAEGKADMVFMARGLVADPELPNKAREGQLKDINRCMLCCRCIEASDSPPVYCSVNARMGREAEFPSEKPAARSKRVLVVGGGAGGMEAARIAALRGHKVTLCEQNSRLGGALLLASITNRYLGAVLRYMGRQVKKLPIEVKLNTRATPELVAKMKPDAVILALGGAIPPIDVPGGKSDIVLDRGDVQSVFSGHAMKKGNAIRRVVSYLGALFIKYFYHPSIIRWLLRFDFPFKKRVVVIGANFAGCELAETLVNSGKKVTIVEESARLGYDIGPTHRWVFLKELREAGTKFFTKAKLVEITNKGVKIAAADSQEFVEADTVVKVGIVPNTALAKELGENVPEVYTVGDCSDPGKLMEAITSGFLAGQKL